MMGTMHGEERQETKTRNKDAALIRIQKQVMEKGRMRSGALSARQMQMISYLSKAQLKYFLSYSPARQARIMEEIERKLERREEYAAPSSDNAENVRDGSFDVSAYEDLPERGYLRDAARDQDMAMRQITQADIRTRKMHLRTGSGGKTPAKETAITERGAPKHIMAGAAAGKKRSLRSDSGKGDPYRSQAGAQLSGSSPSHGGGQKKAFKGKGVFVRKKAEMEKNRSAARISSGEDAHAHKDKDKEHTLQVGKKAGAGKVISSEKERIRQLEGGIRVTAAHGKNGPGLSSPAVKESTVDTGQNAGRAKTVNEAVQKEKDRMSMPAIGRAKTFGEKKKAGEGKAFNPAFFDGKTGELYERFREKEETALLSETKKRRSAAGGFLRDQTEAQILSGTEKGKDFSRREVALKAVEEKKDTFSAPYEKGAYRSGERKKTSRIGKGRKQRRKEERYRKRYVAELIAIIEKDMAKEQGIKQAQRSGQISSSVSELTDAQRRSSFRIAAIPLRLSLKMMTKRLREELKKRLKEAARMLLKYAATFAAPVLAILLIVMLLSGILMVGITQETSTGTGLGWQIVQEAMKHIGLPYVYGGTSLETGCDCSGFVWAIYNLFGYNLPRTAGEQYAYGRKVGSDISDWQLGDLIYYSRTGTVQSGGGTAEHIVIYIGGGQVISCGPVAVYNWDYRSDYYGTCRIIPDEGAAGDFSGSTNEEICWNYFLSQGFSRAATAGILGNMYVESAGTFDPSIHQFGGGPGRGLCQWEESYSGGSGRYNNLVAFASSIGKSWDDIEAQLQFVCYELNSGAMNPYFSKFGGVEAFKHLADPVTATYVFLCGFEYCGDPGQGFLESNFSLSTRTSHATWAFAAYV